MHVYVLFSFRRGPGPRATGLELRPAGLAVIGIMGLGRLAMMFKPRGQLKHLRDLEIRDMHVTGVVQGCVRPNRVQIVLGNEAKCEFAHEHATLTADPDRGGSEMLSIIKHGARQDRAQGRG